MKKRRKILISAYACAPNSGSEPGVGWNFVIGLSAYHEVHVITEKKKFQKPIEEFLQDHPTLKTNLKFYFIEKSRAKTLRKVWPPSYYWFYRAWQKKALLLAKELDECENFDLVHHLTMVGYREPSYLWKVNKPFVWGPLGGLENSPWSFLPALGLKGMVFYTSRNLLNSWQRNYLPRPKKAANKKDARLIAATPANAKLVKALWGQDALVMTEVGSPKSNRSKITERNNIAPLQIIWSGLHIPRKNLPLLLRALQHISVPYHLHVLGEGEMTGKWQQLAKKWNMQERLTWHGWLSWADAQTVMGQGHVLCITSISDLTSTVTLEGLSHGLPIICLDHCGFAHVVDDNCGIKIAVDNPTNAAANIKRALETLYHNELCRQKLSMGALQRAKEFDWAVKIDKLNLIYDDLLNEHAHG